ncbi:hypothetical protein [Aliarcobacter cryaerophilus]|uniref:hypothetical protein n=1 Tax=Aliarcobacter cryaerophilus TaxID=28198 RepID=UPI000834F43F|nr:hypothetical protein [Aliarcobacter cryaerophilus]
METLLQMIMGIIAAFAVIFFILTVKSFIKTLFLKADAESVRFANNTVSNHARTTGITSSGKITHHKHSCGGASFPSEEIKEDSIVKNTSLVIKVKKPKASFTFVPQTRLHGGGWFA